MNFSLQLRLWWLDLIYEFFFRISHKIEKLLKFSIKKEIIILIDSNFIYQNVKVGAERSGT